MHKQWIALILAACLALTMGACDKKEKKDTQIRAKMFHSETRAQEDVRLRSVANQIVGGLFVGNFNDYTEAEKKTICSYIASAHPEKRHTLTFHKDGTATLTSVDGTWLISNKWIRNSFTADLPAPEIGTPTMSMEEETENERRFVVLIKSSGDTKAYAAYCKSLVKAGYKSVGGKIYDDGDLFRGVRKDSKTVNIGVTGKGYILTVTVPKALPVTTKK